MDEGIVSLVRKRIRNPAYNNVWSIPIYNEAENIPRLVERLGSISQRGNVLFCFVNNSSSDNSLGLLEAYLENDNNIHFVLTDANLDVRCCGVPRKIGFEYPMGCTNISETSVFYTTDANSLPPLEIIDEGDRLIRKGEHDLISFPIVYDKQFVEYAKNLNPVLGEYLETVLNREELLNRQLIEMGFIKIRGKGFAISKRMYDLIGGHKQPFDSEGLALKGESHLVGKKVKSQNGSIVSSPYPVIVTPRRFIAEMVGDEGVYREGKEGIYYEPKRYGLETVPENLDIPNLMERNNRSFFKKVCKVVIQNDGDDYTKRGLLNHFYSEEESEEIVNQLKRATSDISYEFSGQLNTIIDFDAIYMTVSRG